MRHFIYLTILLLTLIVPAGCSDDIRPPSGAAVPDGVPVDIVTSAQIPELASPAGSRAMDDQPTIDELRNTLRVNLFVFDPAGVMLQFIGPEDITIINIDPDTNRVHFKVRNIYSSSQPRRLHFVITSAPDLKAIPGGEYIAAMAGETTTLPALIVTDGTDAYWGFRDLDYISANMELTVKLIRNFVKLTVTSSANPATFRILGYTVVNRPSRGTIAPFIYRDHLFASFLNPDNSLMDYDEIIAQGYYGVNPAGSDISMTHTTAAEVEAALTESERAIAAGATDTPCYIYERTQSTITSAGPDVMVTYVIVAAEYRGQRCYYKIDIGHDKEGKFGFYDLLRNFQYSIAITEVGGEGAATVADAMNGAAHNNLSTSVVTRDLFSIGYEGDKIEVSSTRVIFTEQNAAYDIRFRYTTPDGTPFNPALLKVYDIADETVEYNMSGVTSTATRNIDLSGDVIRSATLLAEPGGTGWYILRVATAPVPADSRRLEQNIRIYYSGGSAGLGRTVTLMLRRPWQLTGITATSPGTALKATLDIAFDIPSGLSQSQFPLILTFESDKQNICALNGSPLTVATGRSGFDNATTDRVILYEWRIEWAEYTATSDNGGGRYTARFILNTDAAADRLYNTLPIDNAAIPGRDNNNATSGFAIRIANRGLKYFQPVYVNIRR